MLPHVTSCLFTSLLPTLVRITAIKSIRVDTETDMYCSYSILLVSHWVLALYLFIFKACVCGGSVCITSRGRCPGSPACLVYLSCFCFFIFGRRAGLKYGNASFLLQFCLILIVHPQDAGMIYTHLMTHSLFYFPQELESGGKCVKSVMVVHIVLERMWKMCLIVFFPAKLVLSAVSESHSPQHSVQTSLPPSHSYNCMRSHCLSNSLFFNLLTNKHCTFRVSIFSKCFTFHGEAQHFLSFMMSLLYVSSWQAGHPPLRLPLSFIQSLFSHILSCERARELL